MEWKCIKRRSAARTRPIVWNFGEGCWPGRLQAGCVFLLVGLLMLCGCGQPDEKDSSASPEHEPNADVEHKAAASDNSPQKVISREPLEAFLDAPGVSASETQWHTLLVADAKVGHVKTTFEKIQVAKQDLLRMRSSSEMTLLRFGQETRISQEIVSIEWPDRSPICFRAIARSASGQQMTTGRFQQDRVRLVTTTSGGKTTTEIPWKPRWGGVFALEHALLDQSFQDGETRTLTMFMPLINTRADVTLVDQGMEETKLLVGRRELRRVAVTTTAKKTTLEEVRWLDEQGETLKSYSPLMQQTMYRATEQLALAENQPVADLGKMTSVSIDRRLEGIHGKRQVVYRARVTSGKIGDMFAEAASQRVKHIDDSTCDITVRLIRPDIPASLDVVEDRPTDQDTAANAMIESDAPEIRKLALSIAGEERDVWKVATALERATHATVSRKSFSEAFLSASEVLASREGDCTEHAVLLAALCRARDIPARVAIGLVYVPGDNPQGEFAFHMWNEVWIEDRWIPLDAMLGEGGIGCGHIKLFHSSLSGAGPLGTFLPVLDVIGRLKLAVISIDESP